MRKDMSKTKRKGNIEKELQAIVLSEKGGVKRTLEVLAKSTSPALEPYEPPVAYP